MNRNRWLAAIAILVMASWACGALGGGGSGSSSAGSPFPMPPDASHVQDMGNGTFNFQTAMSLKDVMSFYRDAFSKKGITERTANTVTSDTTFNLVFDGDPSGKAIVVQGVDLGNGMTNGSIRYEST